MFVRLAAKRFFFVCAWRRWLENVDVEQINYQKFDFSSLLITHVCVCERAHFKLRQQWFIFEVALRAWQPFIECIICVPLFRLLKFKTYFPVTELIVCVLNIRLFLISLHILSCQMAKQVRPKRLKTYIYFQSTVASFIFRLMFSFGSFFFLFCYVFFFISFAFFCCISSVVRLRSYIILHLLPFFLIIGQTFFPIRLSFVIFVLLLFRSFFAPIFH